jgi:hypothetical protein
VRDRLVEEISALESAEAALAWAIRRIGLKNSLTGDDASTVDMAFRDRIRVFEPATNSSASYPAVHSEQAKAQTHSASPDGQSNAPQRGSRKPTKHNSERTCAQNATTAGLVKPTRARDKDHLRSISLQPCTVCGRQPCEAHLIRFAQPRALGRRVSDEFTVPLCRLHHRELHRHGDERVWWNRLNIDPLPIALRLWQQTRSGDAPIFDDANLKNQEGEMPLTGSAGTAPDVKQQSPNVDICNETAQ